MDREEMIRSALVRVGVNDVLEWGRANCTKSLVDLNEELDAGVAPVEVEQFMAAAARDSGRYDDFVRAEAVRRLNEYFPDGFGASQDQKYGLAAGWAMWAGLFEPAHKGNASEVWSKLEETMRAHPGWCPRNPADPLLVSAFNGRSFDPSEGKRRFEKAVAFMERTARRANRPWSDAKAVENLAQVAPGYGYLYGLYAVDGQVCNGGFVQFYENHCGAFAALGVGGFRAIGRDDFARIVEESMRYAARERPELFAVGRAVADQWAGLAQARAFEKLDKEYYSLCNAEAPGWLEFAMISLVESRRELF